MKQFTLKVFFSTRYLLLGLTWKDSRLNIIFVSHQICPWRSMFPWELRSIDCSERTEITTLFVIGKGKEGKRGRRIRNVTFFLICLKVSFFEKSYQKSHEVVITFLLPLLKTRTWVLWHEIVQSHMKTAEMWIWRHERRWKSFPFKLLLTPFCYWMYCVRRGWKVGPPPSRWVPFLMKNWNPPLLLWTSVKVINLSMTS